MTSDTILYIALAIFAFLLTCGGAIGFLVLVRAGNKVQAQRELEARKRRSQQVSSSPSQGRKTVAEVVEDDNEEKKKGK